jgi:hypothetical protein
MHLHVVSCLMHSAKPKCKQVNSLNSLMYKWAILHSFKMLQDSHCSNPSFLFNYENNDYYKLYFKNVKVSTKLDYSGW